MSDLAEWANNNSGWISILVFSLSMLLSVAVWVLRRLLSKPRIKLEDFEEPTFCSSFDAPGKVGFSNRTTFLIYLKIRNIGRTSVQIWGFILGVGALKMLMGSRSVSYVKKHPC